MFTRPLLFRVKDKAALIYTETSAATAGVAATVLGKFSILTILKLKK